MKIFMSVLLTVLVILTFSETLRLVILETNANLTEMFYMAFFSLPFIAFMFVIIFILIMAFTFMRVGIEYIINKFKGEK